MQKDDFNGVLTGFNGIQRLPGDFTMKKGWNQPFYRGFGGYQSQNRVYYPDLSWLVQDWVYPKIAKWCTVPTKNGGIPPKTLENQVDSVRMWTKNIPQLLFCLQTVHTGIPWIPSFHGQAQAWVRSSRFWWESKMPVRVPGSWEVSGWPWGRGADPCDAPGKDGLVRWFFVSKTEVLNFSKGQVSQVSQCWGGFSDILKFSGMWSGPELILQIWTLETRWVYTSLWVNWRW